VVAQVVGFEAGKNGVTRTGVGLGPLDTGNGKAVKNGVTGTGVGLWLGPLDTGNGVAHDQATATARHNGIQRKSKLRPDPSCGMGPAYRCRRRSAPTPDESGGEDGVSAARKVYFTTIDPDLIGVVPPLSYTSTPEAFQTCSRMASDVPSTAVSR
jgi:hypothetical protein